jgi:RNA polymerase sigma factor (sigma-70 family)
VSDDTDQPDDEVPISRPPEAPLTVYQHTLIRHALHVVPRAAKQVARRFHRFVNKEEELYAVGTFELYRLARIFDPDYSHDFAVYAFYGVRRAMAKSLCDGEVFQERVKRCVDIATDQLLAYLTDREYDASKHDDLEARRRFRAIANGMMGAAFMSGVEEAQRRNPEAETAERQEYEIAIRALRAALQKLSDADHRLLVLVYRELKDLKEASAELGIPYGTIRRRHAGALERLCKELRAQGVTQAPRPAVVPDPGKVLHFRVRAAQNDHKPDG